MRRFNLLLLVAVTGFVSFGCNKDDNGDGPPPADTAAVITIDHPATNVLYSNGFALIIDGTITDLDLLESARYEIRNKTTNALLKQGQSTTGNVNFYRFGWQWNVTGITAPTPAIVKVISRDRYGYETSSSVEVTLDQ